jgi:AraC-like DNA-binding protein
VEVLYQPFPMPGAARGHIWHHVPETRRPRHFHAEPELNLIAAGSARFGAGETVLSVRAGDLLWWPPGQDHVLLDASLDFDLYVIGVTAHFSERVLGPDGIATVGGAARLRLETGHLGRFAAVCARPVEVGATAAIERQIGDLWCEAHRLRRSAPDRHPLTARTLASVIARPDLKRSDLARFVRGNVSEVSRRFHQDVGLTLTAYRTRLRLLRFIEQVEQGARFLPAAMEAGFGSYSQCHRTFQQTFGCTPRAFFGMGILEEMRDRFAPMTVSGKGLASRCP